MNHHSSVIHAIEDRLRGELAGMASELGIAADVRLFGQIERKIARDLASVAELLDREAMEGIRSRAAPACLPRTAYGFVKRWSLYGMWGQSEAA